MNIIPLEDAPSGRPNLNGEKYFLVKSKVTLNEIEAFLESISQEKIVSFHDQFYMIEPETDDPGAYVDIRRRDSDPSMYEYMYGNHHWSTNWSHQSLKFLSAYILINADSERFDGRPFTLQIYKRFRAEKISPTQNKEEIIKKETFLSRLFSFINK